ncbi:hypothetical protein [Janthinobacterium sp. UMAB-56]|uniref:hypothetical protein n=1 Tax=Janthinobacterium sp. UMAB-56 TaxID=1365361 RepID=UPI001C5A1C2C|nr:hypothetical protein [Janthinobacterium sp. UMAB-56]
MHDGKITASATDQIVHYARALVEARARSRAAKESNDQAVLELAKRAEYRAGKDLDRAVDRHRPP